MALQNPNGIPSLTDAGNKYEGLLQPGISAKVTLGANDYDLWHVATAVGSKTRLAYASAAVTVQKADSICAFADNSDRSLEFINLELQRFGAQETMCIDQLYPSDYAEHSSFFGHSIDAELANQWAIEFAEQFSLEMQAARWVGGLTGYTSIDDIGGNAAGTYGNGLIQQLRGKLPYDAATNAEGYQEANAVNVPVDSTNIVDEIKKVLALLPFKVKQHKDFKVVLSPKAANALQTAALVQTGVNNMAAPQADLSNGLLMNNFLGLNIDVYVAEGLGYSVDSEDVILAGVMGNSKNAFAKWGVNQPSDEGFVQLRTVQDDDYLQMRIGAAQAVGIVPNVSQVAINH